MRLITSTPVARATSTTPEPTSEVARLVACWLLPHWVSMVVAAVVSGRPAASHAVRVMLKLCSPTWLTQPPTTWPTSAGSMPVRSMMAFCTTPSSSAGCMDDSPPPRRPTGLRTASTMTTLLMGRAYGEPHAALHSSRGAAGRDRGQPIRPRHRRQGVRLRPCGGRWGGHPLHRFDGHLARPRHRSDGELVGRRRRRRRRPVRRRGARPVLDVRPGERGRVDRRRPGGADRRVGAHPPVLRALRHADRPRRPTSGR